MKESNTIATNATIKLLHIEIWLNIIRECMKESKTFVVNVMETFLRESILLNIKGHIMQDSNTSASNVTIKQLQNQILLRTKGQCIKESNNLAGNATNSFLSRENLVNTKGQCMKEIKYLQKMRLSGNYNGWVNLQPVMGSKIKFFCLLVRDDHQQKKLHKINYTGVKTHRLFPVVVVGVV